MQQELFNNSEENELKTTEIKSGIIKISGKNSASPRQAAFNKLSEKIEKLKIKIETERKQLEEYNKFYTKNIFPVLPLIAAEQRKLSYSLHNCKEKLTKTVQEKKAAVIVALLSEVFIQSVPTEEDKKLYNSYSDVSYEEEEEYEEEMQAHLASEYLSEEFGIEIDPDELKNGTPDFEKIEKLLKERLEAEQGKARKKTKRQLEKEARQQQAESLSQKNMRDIYLSLVKMLHPDKEKDETLRLEKEEYMKLVTDAYQKKELIELLRLELQWIGHHKQSLENTSDEVLDSYIGLLKQQVSDLKYEAEGIKYNPAFAHIHPLIGKNSSETFLFLNHRLSVEQNRHGFLKQTNEEMASTAKLRQLVTTTVNEMYKSLEIVEDHFEDVWGDFNF